MDSWLSRALANMTLSEDVEGYLLGRGAREPSYQALKIVTWQELAAPAEDEVFRKRHGALGEKIVGDLVCPIYSPKGGVLGFEARSTKQKLISEYLLPEAAWSPVWLGLHSVAMQRIWAGGDLWVTEGLFDLFPLEWVVPASDVVLASLRARLSDKHVEFLRRFCRGWVHMVYDLDATGRKATTGWVDQTGKRRWGALDQLRNAGLKCRDVPYTGGKDPGEIWSRGGIDALRATFM